MSDRACEVTGGHATVGTTPTSVDEEAAVTEVVLVRHGETVWHAENRYAGVSDVALTRRGEEQAVRLAGWAATAGLVAVWASPLSRARRTAQGCAMAADLPLDVDARLRELDFGEGEGLTSTEMAERFPEARAAFLADPAAHPLPGGEDPVEAADRFTDCLQEISEKHPDGRVLVVAHSSAIRLALCGLIGVPLREYRRLFPGLRNCTLTELRLRAGRAALLQYNSPVEAS
jgi:probable phosphoglycerate mutase